MPKLLLFLLSQSTSIDIRTNQLSIFEVIEEVQAFGFPNALRRADLVTLWERKPGEENMVFDQRTRIANPDGGEITALDNRFPMHGMRHRIINRLVDLPLPIPGSYKIEIYLKLESETDWGLPVTVYSLPVYLARKPEAQSS